MISLKHEKQEDGRKKSQRKHKIWFWTLHRGKRVLVLFRTDTREILLSCVSIVSTLILSISFSWTIDSLACFLILSLVQELIIYLVKLKLKDVNRKVQKVTTMKVENEKRLKICFTFLRQDKTELYCIITDAH